MNNLDDYKFIFNIKSPHWDEKPNSWKQSKPITLGQILDNEQLDFTDGGYIRLDEIDWVTDDVLVGTQDPLPKQPKEGL